MNNNILIVEDDPSISKLVAYNLNKAEFSSISIGSYEKLYDILNSNKIDLIILDINLPKKDGYQICKELKEKPKYKEIPVIMLTARGEEIDRITGLELGADDYLVKPFSPTELILRIKAILRRSKTFDSKEDIISFNEIIIDIAKPTVKIENKEINLTPMEFKLLVTFIKRKDRVQTRAGLLSDVWDMNSEVYTRTVDTHIKRLREKLGLAGKYIKTVVGIGYKFSEDED